MDLDPILIVTNKGWGSMVSWSCYCDALEAKQSGTGPGMFCSAEHISQMPFKYPAEWEHTSRPSTANEFDMCVLLSGCEGMQGDGWNVCRAHACYVFFFFFPPWVNMSKPPNFMLLFACHGQSLDLVATQEKGRIQTKRQENKSIHAILRGRQVRVVPAIDRKRCILQSSGLFGLRLMLLTKDAS